MYNRIRIIVGLFLACTVLTWVCACTAHSGIDRGIFVPSQKKAELTAFVNKITKKVVFRTRFFLNNGKISTKDEYISIDGMTCEEANEAIAEKSSLILKELDDTYLEPHILDNPFVMECEDWDP